MSITRLSTCLAALCLSIGAQAFADAPSEVKIKSITYAGSGCPAGSVAENIAPDMKAMTLLFDSYTAETGNGLPPSEERKNCQLTVEMEFPQGWSVSLATLDYRGFAGLDRGVVGVQKADYYFQGETAQASFQTTFRGELFEDYQVRDKLELDALVWSPCGATQTLNINTQIRVSGGNNFRSGIMTVDSLDKTVQQKYGLQWKRCDGGSVDPERPGDGGGDGDDDGRPGDIDAPTNVTINSIIHAGSGCPAGTVAKNVAADSKAFTLLFDSFIAEVGPGVSAREMRKNCQLNIDLDYPDGWTYALATFDYRGFVSVDPGVKGTQKSTYYFQGETNQLDFDTNFAGPLDTDYAIRDTLPLDALIWAPCGAKRSLNLNTQVRLDNTRARRNFGIMTVDSVDGKVHHTYGLVWRRCH